MKIVILGAGVQGTLYGVRLARAGHDVTVIARGLRAEQLRSQAAVIQHALTGRRDTVQLPVSEMLSSEAQADLCLVWSDVNNFRQSCATLQRRPTSRVSCSW